ncbi:MAG: hypothetical protein PVG90_12385, partial [Bacillota bacterium]
LSPCQKCQACLAYAINLLLKKKSPLAGFPVPESRRYHPDAPMDFAGLAELKISTFASSKVVQCMKRPREERR